MKEENTNKIIRVSSKERKNGEKTEVPQATPLKIVKWNILYGRRKR